MPRTLLLRILAPTRTLNRKRLERVSGLAAVAALISFGASAHAQTVTVTDTTPSDYSNAQPAGTFGGDIIGSFSEPPTPDFYNFYASHALLWHTASHSTVDLHPAQYTITVGTGISGSGQVGYGFTDTSDGGEGSSGNYSALLWHGTAASVVNLNPSNQPHYIQTGSQAFATDGDTQVGQVFDDAGDYSYSDSNAALWYGTAASFVNLNPAPTDGYPKGSVAYAVSGKAQVGYDYDIVGSDEDGNEEDENLHAVLWYGTAASVVDLSPSDDADSQAYGVSGNTQVGDDGHALLWHGTAASVVDLNPVGYDYSSTVGVSGDVQVGFGLDNDDDAHALLWRGTAASVLDLSVYLPAGLSDARASAVSGSGDVYDVVGTARDAQNDIHALLWHVVFAGKPAIDHLYPASRTVGRDAFTLTVAGSGFTPASKVQWNGIAQATTFVSSTTLTASIPASLIATAGTASVTVSTPGVGTSNSHVETIMPRPMISSLSPSSRKAGSSAFTLTVTGTGFRPASFYSPTVVKWNGMALTTTFVSDTTLTAQVPATLVAHAGAAKVMATTPQVATTTPQTFTITP